MKLKDAISEKHSIAEKMQFNQRMFKGELNKDQYILYLSQQLGIFDSIEKYELPHHSLNRVDSIYNDLLELFGANQSDNLEVKLLESTIEYRQYLLSLNYEAMLPHIYLNYLAIAFGGQMMKAKVPGSGKMYEFENVQECIGSIRVIQKDEWADEVNKGLDYIINIFDELQRETR